MARKLPGSDMDNENQMSPPLSPKRSFAQDHLDPVDSKRRHVLSENVVRTPLGESCQRLQLSTLLTTAHLRSITTVGHGEYGQWRPAMV